MTETEERLQGWCNYFKAIISGLEDENKKLRALIQEEEICEIKIDMKYNFMYRRGKIQASY